jgi:hypothetical protein
MYSPNQNPSELYYGRHALLRQEVRNSRLARQRAARSTEGPDSGRLMTVLARACAMWERRSVPFFRT